MTTRIRPWAAALGAVPLALLLAGCVGLPGIPDPGSAGDPNVDELVEDIVEGSGGEVDFEPDALPADFPEGDIPLVPGDVGPSMSISDGQAWSVTIYAPDEATAGTAADLLEAAGFSNESGVFWEDPTYTVILVSTQEHEDGRWAVTYQVQAK